MNKISNLNLVIFLILSSLPTVFSFFGYFEGNKQRLTTLFILLTLFLFQNCSITNIKETFIKIISNNLFRFLFLTIIISVLNIYRQSMPSSINYVDFFAPCCLIIYGIHINQNDLILKIKKIIFILSLFWLLVGFIELIANIFFGNTFCLPDCIYYNYRPNALISIQNLFGINSYIALESIGLNTQQFSLVLGLLFLHTLNEIQKKFRVHTLIFFLLIVFIEIFSMSFTVFIAQGISLIFLFNLQRGRTGSKLFIFIILLSLLFVGYFLNFLFFSQSIYYISELLIRPVFFIFQQDWSEILLGINDSKDIYPAENRLLVLFYRFGILWFVFLMLILYSTYNKLNDVTNVYITNLDRTLFIFLLVSPIHNHLWHTISGNIIFSFIVIYFYELLKDKNN